MASLECVTNRAFVGRNNCLCPAYVGHAPTPAWLSSVELLELLLHGADFEFVASLCPSVKNVTHLKRRGKVLPLAKKGKIFAHPKEGEKICLPQQRKKVLPIPKRRKNAVPRVDSPPSSPLLRNWPSFYKFQSYLH